MVETDRGSGVSWWKRLGYQERVAEPTSRVGREFAGYRIDRVVGRGGLGEVYAGTHPRLHMQHALKVLFPELTADAEFRDRFHRMAREIARLSHPNIIPIFDSGEEDRRLYLVMPYIEGLDLRRLLGRQGALAPELAFELLGQAALALDRAHAEGTVHRALKPENVLVQLPERRRARTHLVDFGMTRVSNGDPVERLQESMSTLRYMAPEQINRPDVDARADVYSLGCILFECLTGTPPFERDTEGAVLYAHTESSRSVCGCEIARIQDRFSLREFRSLVARFTRTGRLPPALRAIARECGDVGGAVPGS